MAFQLTYSEVAATVGDRLHYGRSGWDATVTARLAEIVKAGAAQFYWPPPITKTGVSHRWSFLKPAATIVTEDGKADYLLPADYGGMVESKLFFAAGDNRGTPVTIGPVGAVLRYRESNPSDGTPRIAAVAPRRSAGTAPQRMMLMLGPAADDQYTLWYRYQITPESLDSSHVYHLGSGLHSETLVASCLAIAETRYGLGPGGQQDYFLQRLAASISHDRQNDPGHYGYMGDGPSPVATKRYEYATFNGVLYEN